MQETVEPQLNCTSLICSQEKYLVNSRLPSNGSLLDCETLAPFVSVGEKDQLSQGRSVPKPKRDIRDQTKTKTKTITIMSESNHFMNGGIAPDVTSSSVESVLESSDNVHINGGIRCSTKTPRPCAKNSIGALPLRCTTFENGQEVLSAGSTSSAKGRHTYVDDDSRMNVKIAHGRKSLFSSIIRRMSTIRHKPNRVESGDNDSTQPADVKLSPNSTRPKRSASRSVRRWFTKRIWKPRNTLDLAEKSVANTVSQQSVNSVATLLESGYQIKSNEEESCNEAMPTSNHPGSVPTARKYLQSRMDFGQRWHNNFTVDQNFESSVSNGNLTSSIPKKICAPPTDPDFKARRDESFDQLPSNSFNSQVSLTNQYIGVKGNNRQLYFPPTAYFDSTQSVGAETSKHCQTNTRVLMNRNEPHISLSESRLAQQSQHQHPVSPSSIHITPSYLNASLAAFGYSRYGSACKSHQSVILSESPHSTLDGFPFVQKVSSARIQQPSNELHTSGVMMDDGQCGSMRQNDASVHRTKPAGRPRSGCTDQTKPQSTCTGAGSDEQTVNVRLRRTRTISQSTTEDQQHWQRSSLIMLAVSHAGPRPKTTTPTSVEPLCEQVNEPSTISPLVSPVSVTSIDDNSTESSLQNKHNPSEHDDILSNAVDSFNLTESSKALCFSSSPMNDRSSSVTAATNSIPLIVTINAEIISDSSDVINGHYYMKQVNQTELELTDLIHKTEQDILNPDLNDDVSGQLRTACGKAKLLINEKFRQFRSLCEANLRYESSSNSTDLQTNNDDGQLVTLISDLDGFWAMTSLQVDDVRRLFAQVEQLRENNWLPIETTKPKPITSRKPVKSLTKPVSNTEARKRSIVARAQARERLQLIKREMRFKQLESSSPGPSGDDDVVIFI